MSNLRAWIITILVVLTVATLSIFPPSENLRRGRDLAGGVSLVYTVDLDRGEDADQTISSMIDVLRKRVDPEGLFEISFVRQGRERIEVSMPLPTEEVKRLKQEYEDALGEFEAKSINEAELERVMRLGGEERDEALERLAAGSEERLELLEDAAQAHDLAERRRREFYRQQETVEQIREQIEQVRGEAAADGAEEGGDDAGDADAEAQDDAQEAEEPVDPRLPALRQDLADAEEYLDNLLVAAGEAEVAYEEAREAVLASVVSPEEVERALNLSDDQRRIEDAVTGETRTLPSPRETALENLREKYPNAVEQINAVVEAYETYADKRQGLDDVSDLKRLLRGAGVLNFRIAVDPGEHPEEARLRRELQERGPRGVRSVDARWFEIEDPSNWYDTLQQLEALQRDPAGFWAGLGYVGEEYDGRHYLLLWDTPEKALTEDSGDWSVASAFRSQDQLGRTAIGFSMDARGATLLGELTGAHVGQQMAVVLDDQIYTAPNLQSRISSQGQITGSFEPREITYIIRTLNAGSLQAKLSPEPISQHSVGPSLGADNLRRGFTSAIAALVAVAFFMVLYYFGAGAIAVAALAANAVIILGAMSLNRAAFTLPGVAGIILTFGMAVDANVLIYERIREELEAGADFKTSVRLGYQKVLSTIVDANITNLIVCFVLYRFATQDIRGFAITLGIGIVATLFSTLVITRVIFALLVDHAGVRRMKQLPMVIPALQRALSPSVNWLRLRPAFIVISLGFLSLGLGMVAYQGEKMLDQQFLGGVSVTAQLEGEKKTRQDIADVLNAYIEDAPPDSPAITLRNAEVLPLSPEADGVTSDQFRIQAVADDPDAVSQEIVTALADLIETRPPLRFEGWDIERVEDAPVYKILDANLGEDIGRPEVANDVSDFVGGVAIVLENISPEPTLENLRTRVEQLRQQSDFTQVAGNRSRVIAIEGTEEEVRSAVIVSIDPTISFFDNESLWQDEVLEPEWRLVRESLTNPTTLAGVQSFSPEIAATFQASAIVAIAISFLGILVYIWIRFGSARYSLAAIAALVHDVIAVVGLIAVAEIIYEHAEPVATQLLILPFKIDLGLIAALLTIIGYSLNDTIVILDRIRENRGKLAYASADVVNKSINQCISRTIITSSTTIIAVGIMYVFGGEGIRSFTYALLCGVVVGTYSSVAVAAPLVFSKGQTAKGGAGRKGARGAASASTEQKSLAGA